MMKLSSTCSFSLKAIAGNMREIMNYILGILKGKTRARYYALIDFSIKATWQIVPYIDDFWQ